MNLLVAVSNYPNAGHPYSGAFNERSAHALRELGHRVEVVAPRPYVPRSLARCNARWRAYGQIQQFEVQHGIPVYRPAYLQVPRLGGALCADITAYLGCVRAVKGPHGALGYDAILAFNLIAVGGPAWRLGRRLGIPAVGWATGNDVRVPANSSYGRSLRVTLQRLDLVFYQSTELLERAAALCLAGGVDLERSKHTVLPRGIEAPPAMSEATRQRVRAELGLRPEQIMVLYVGRMVEAKGVFDLVDAMDLARLERRDLVCVMVGAHTAFDDSAALRERLKPPAALPRHVQLLPACRPAEVWHYLNAADIFAFPSHSEGMPNSLLEAMAVGLPSVACAIPPVLDLDSGLGALKTIPPRDPLALARALLELARSPEQRRVLGERGKERVLGNYLATANMAEAIKRLSVARRRSDAFFRLRDSIPTVSRGPTLAPSVSLKREDARREDG